MYQRKYCVEARAGISGYVNESEWVGGDQVPGLCRPY